MYATSPQFGQTSKDLNATIGLNSELKTPKGTVAGKKSSPLAAKT
jgi:hypothetical protein